jgi:signal transduction histidine kinase
MMAYHLHESLYHQAPLAWGQALLHSFSPHAWPLILFFGLSGASLGALLGGLYQRLEASRLAYQDRLRSLAAEISLVEERERHRLATQLHEHLGQVLALAQIKLGALGAALNSPDLKAGLQEVRQDLDQAIKYTRTLTFELSPPVLYELGLDAAIEWLAKQMRESGGLEVEVQKDRQPLPPLPDEARILLYLAVRELLTNVAKHAQARQARISWSRQGHSLRLQVVDDGGGFDVSQKRGTGFGLFSLRERLDHIGGRLEVESQVGQGTAVSVTVPLAPG